MKKSRPVHPDFQLLLDLKAPALISLFRDLRDYIFEICPGSNEMVYHTHALTSVFSLSDKLADAFVTLPIYTNHVNLAFNRGTLLKDPKQLLTGTGNLMRHIDINEKKDYRNPAVKQLIKEAEAFAKSDMDKPVSKTGLTISKINAKKSN